MITRTHRLSGSLLSAYQDVLVSQLCDCFAGLVQDSINRCDVDLRRDLYNGVLLAGLRLFLPLGHAEEHRS